MIANKILEESIAMGGMIKTSNTRRHIRYISKQANECVNDEINNRIVFIFSKDSSAISICTNKWHMKIIKDIEYISMSNGDKKFPLGC